MYEQIYPMGILNCDMGGTLAMQYCAIYWYEKYSNQDGDH